MTKKNKRAMRIFIAIGLAMTMSFAVIGLVACDNGYRERTLDERIGDVSAQVLLMQKGGIPTAEHIDALLVELATLSAEVAQLQGNNTAMLNRLDGYRAALEVLRGANMKTEYFELFISTEHSALTHEQLYYRHFWIYVELKNNSGRDLSIIVDKLFWPLIPNWMPDSIYMPEAEKITFPNSSVIRREPVLQSGNMSLLARFELGATGYGEENERLPRGTHELRFVATFCIVGEQGSENKNVTITSNTIVLVVK